MSANYIIKIDSTQRDFKSVCLYNNDNPEDCIQGNIDIVESIKNILNKNQLNLKTDIKYIEPNTGPGSFTGIKTSIVIANTINWQLNNGKFYKPNYGAEPNISTPKNTRSV